MADTVLTRNVERLDGKNYPTWRFRMQVILKAQKVWQVITDNPPDNEAAQAARDAWSEKEMQAQSLIVQTVNTAQAGLIMNQPTARAMWERLERSNRGRLEQQLLNAQCQISQVKWEKSEDAASYVQRVEEMGEQIRSLGGQITDLEIASKAVRGLPGSYSSVADSFNMACTADMTLDRLRYTLIEAEKRMHPLRNDHDKAFKASAPAQTKHKDKANIKCFKCKKLGHFARECVKTKKSSQSQKQPKPQTTTTRNEESFAAKAQVSDDGNEAIFAFHVRDDASEADEIRWSVDSGATRHMTGCGEIFSDFVNESGRSVTVADGRRQLSVGTGTVRFKPVGGEGCKVIEARDVLLVPGLVDNLLSVARMTDAGFKVQFTNDECVVTHERHLVFVANKERGQYQLKATVCHSEEIAQKVVDDDKLLRLWHERLGHTSFDTMRKMSKLGILGNLSVAGKQDLPCTDCVEGKHARNPFARINDVQSEHVLNLLHMDLCGPLPASIGGSHYIFLIVDDYTRKMTVFFLKYKSEVANVFIDFVRRVERQTGHNVKRIRTDNGREFVNTIVSDFLKQNGIIHERTIPYTPQQNGVAERGNRTMIEMARAMLAKARLPVYFWAESVNTAIYIRNRCVNKHDETQSPEEKWTGRKQSTSYFRVFGCTAYAWVPDQHRKKLERKSKRMIFLGYQEGQRGYRLYDPETKSVIASRDVKFFEEAFDVEISGSDDSNNDCGVFKYTSYEDIQPVVRRDNSIPVHTIGQRDIELHDDHMGRQPRDSGSKLRGTTHTYNETQQQGLRRSLRLSTEVDRLQVDPTKKSYCNNVSVSVKEPRTYAEAIESAQREEWSNAIAEELASHDTMQTWEEVPRTENMRTIKSKWVFKVKPSTVDGDTDRYKARLVAVGCSQRYGVNFEDTYSPVVKLSSLRIVLAVANEERLCLRQYDVETAYLHGDLKEEIFMELPPGTDSKRVKHFVCRLKRAIYGLRQSGRTWYLKLDCVLRKEGYKRLESDPCVYVKRCGNEYIVLTVYVDDLLAASTSERFLHEMMEKLKAHFKLKDLGIPTRILGLEIEQDQKLGKISISQRHYINELLSRFEMLDAKPLATPIEIGKKANEEEMTTMQSETPYQNLIGGLMYLVQGSRPDIAFAVHYLSRFNSNHTQEHWKMAKRVLRYLKGTMEYSLTYCREGKQLEGYSDASWNSLTEDGKSVSGYLFKLSGGAVTWRSAKQSMICLSTCEAEYVALCECIKEGKWIAKLLNEIGWGKFCEEPITIAIDNAATKAVMETGGHNKSTKHVEIKYLYTRNEVQEGHFALRHVNTDGMIADMLTKPVPKVKNDFCCKNSGLF